MSVLKKKDKKEDNKKSTSVSYPVDSSSKDTIDKKYVKVKLPLIYTETPSYLRPWATTNTASSCAGPIENAKQKLKKWFQPSPKPAKKLCKSKTCLQPPECHCPLKQTCTECHQKYKLELAKQLEIQQKCCFKTGQAIAYPGPSSVSSHIIYKCCERLITEPITPTQIDCSICKQDQSYSRLVFVKDGRDLVCHPHCNSSNEPDVKCTCFIPNTSLRGGSGIDVNQKIIRKPCECTSSTVFRNDEDCTCQDYAETSFEIVESPHTCGRRTFDSEQIEKDCCVKDRPTKCRSHNVLTDTQDFKYIDQANNMQLEGQICGMECKPKDVYFDEKCLKATRTCTENFPCDYFCQGPCRQYLHKKWTLQKLIEFIILVTVTVICLVATPLLLLYWIYHHPIAFMVHLNSTYNATRSKFDWKKFDKFYINNHSIGMTIGLVTCNGISVLIFRIMRFAPKNIMKFAHLLIYVICSFSIYTGARFSYYYIENEITILMHLKSLHSWLGLTTIIAFILQCVLGIIFHLLFSLHYETRRLEEIFKPFHAAIGIFILISTAATFLTSLQRFVNEHFGSPYLLTTSGDIEIINLIGMVMIIGFILVIIVLSRFYAADIDFF